MYKQKSKTPHKNLFTPAPKYIKIETATKYDKEKGENT